jgi:hypothetical protein
MPVKDWLERRTSHAPPALRIRVMEYALDASGDSMSALLAAAGQDRLRWTCSRLMP